MALLEQVGRKMPGLRTYAVVPLSVTHGAIEWLPKTETAKRIVCAAAGVPDIGNLAGFKLRQRWTGAGKDWGKVFRMSREDVEAAHRAQADADPSLRFALTAYFRDRAATPEDFLGQRAVFAQSLAAVSVATVLLGIGDRHLDNFLVQPDGTLTCIDFGYSFGFGVCLAVPELIPCRLTPLFLNVLGPLNGIEERIAAGFADVCQSKGALIDSAAIFLRDPPDIWARNPGWTASRAKAFAERFAPFSPRAFLLADLRRVVADARARGGRATYVEELLADASFGEVPLVAEPVSSFADQARAICALAADWNVVGRAWNGLCLFI